MRKNRKKMNDFYVLKYFKIWNFLLLIFNMISLWFCDPFDMGTNNQKMLRIRIEKDITY